MGCDQLTAAETFHLFGTSDSEKLKHHSELEHGPHGTHEGNPFTTYSLRTPMRLVVIYEHGLTPEKRAELDLYRFTSAVAPLVPPNVLHERSEATKDFQLTQQFDGTVDLTARSNSCYNDDEPETVVCNSCRGSGMGYKPDSTCTACGGSGELVEQ